MKAVINNATQPLAQSAFSIQHLTVNYGTVPALLDVSLELPTGKLIGVIGPNGSGKSTLVKALLGFLKPDVGSITVLGQGVTSAKNRIAYVPQRREVDWDFPVTVREVAVMGRYGKRRWWQDLTTEDYRWADQSLSKLKMDKFRHRQIGQLSGGQQQRVFLARALAQDAEILLLDEPFTGVDMATEEAILHVLRDYQDQGKTAIVVHHDLSTAASYFDLLVLLKQRLYGFGPPDRVLDPNLLCEVYEGNVRAFAQISRSRGES
jgi:manganese/iron transport system ATP-binding protein/manganese/zinc/iron transport system ATP- binding protein